MSGDHDGLLAGSNLVSFASDVAPELRQDIIECLRYANICADALYSSRQNWRAWLSAYQQAMASAGAASFMSLPDQRLKLYSLRDIRRLKVPAVPNAQQLIQLYSRSVEKLLDSEHAQLFFGSWFSSGRSESFQVVPCAMQDEKEAVILMCGLEMTTMALRPGFFFWQIIGGEMQVRAVCMAFRFSRDRYEPFRKVVQETLVANAARQVMYL